jgi:hypothetical protein
MTRIEILMKSPGIIRGLILQLPHNINIALNNLVESGYGA